MDCVQVWLVISSIFGVIFGMVEWFMFTLLNIVSCVQARHVISGAICGVIGWVTMDNLQHIVDCVLAWQVISVIPGAIFGVIGRVVMGNLLNTVG